MMKRRCVHTPDDFGVRASSLSWLDLPHKPQHCCTPTTVSKWLSSVDPQVQYMYAAQVLAPSPVHVSKNYEVNAHPG